MRVIPKYFVGGVSVTTPILPSVALAIEQLQLAAQKSSDSESGSKKSYIELIFDTKANVLPSDSLALAALAESVGNLEASPAFLNMSKSQQFATVYKRYITMRAAALNAYEGLLSAKEHIIKNGGSEEAAFTPDGYMFVHENGDSEISIIHPTKFNRKTDIPVTNAELLYLRANDPRMAMNDSVLVALTAATSMKEIRDLINSTVQNLGSIGEESEHFINPRTPTTELALLELAAANISEADILNMDIGTLLHVKLKNKNNEKLVLLAIKSIEAQLNPQQRALLLLRAKELGGKTTAESIITEYLYSMLNVEKSFTLDIKTTKTADGSSKSGKSGSGKEESLDDTNMPPVVEWLAGRGDVSIHRISNGSRGSLFATGNEMTITRGGAPAGIMNLHELGESQFAGAFKLGQASVGGVQIDLEKRQHVLVDGNEIVNMPLPVDLAALAENKIIPDFDAMDRFSLAWRELQSMGIDGSNPADVDKINQVLQSYLLPVLYKGLQNGQPIVNLVNYRRFGVINGFVDGAVLGDNAVFNSALTKIEGRDAEALLKEFKNHYKGYKGNERGGFLFGIGAVPDLYRAAIFIPLRESYVNAYAGSGLNLKAGDSADITRRMYDTQQRQENPVSFKGDNYVVLY